jgi:hypothetical protein
LPLTEFLRYEPPVKLTIALRVERCDRGARPRSSYAVQALHVRTKPLQSIAHGAMMVASVLTVKLGR